MSEIVLLFGKSYSGGGIELKNSSYASYEYFSPDEKYTSKTIQDLNFKKCELNIFQRLFLTYKFLINSNYSNYYLTNSVQAVFFPFLFRKKNFIWISQGIEVFFDYKTYWLFRIPFVFIINSSKNLIIRAANPLLRDFLLEIGIFSVDFDPNINLQPNKFKKAFKQEIHLFALYRDSKCKNPKLLKQLIQSKALRNKKWTVVDLSTKNNINFFQNYNVKYVRGPVSKEVLLFNLNNCSHLVYPSYFEGFGLLVNEAIEVGVRPIVGPLSLFKQVDGVLVSKSYKFNEWQSIIQNLHL